MPNLYYVDDEPQEGSQSLHVVASSPDDATREWIRHYGREEEDKPRAIFLVVEDVDLPEGPLGWHDKVKTVWENPEAESR